MTEASDYAQERLEAEATEALYQKQLNEWVQRRLKQLNYLGGGEIDGTLNYKTQGEILDFRNRNGLPLKPMVDDQLIETLKVANAIELPYNQVTAPTQVVAQKVEAVNQTVWSKFYAKLLLFPSLATTLITGIAQNFDQAITMLQPIRRFLDEVLVGMDPLTTILITSTITTVVAGLIYWSSSSAEGSLVEGYRTGQVKMDNPETTEPVGVAE